MADKMKSMYKNLNSSLSRVFGNKGDQPERVRYSKRLREKHSRDGSSQANHDFATVDDRRASDRNDRMEPTVQIHESRGFHESTAHAGGSRDTANYSTLHDDESRQIIREPTTHSVDRAFVNEFSVHTGASRYASNDPTVQEDERGRVINDPTVHVLVHEGRDNPAVHVSDSRGVSSEPTIQGDENGRIASNPTVHRQNRNAASEPTFHESQSRLIRNESTSHIGKRPSTRSYRGIQPVGSLPRSRPLRTQMENSFLPMDYTGTPMSSRDVSLEWDDTHREERSVDPDFVHEEDLPVLEYDVEQLYANKPHLAKFNTEDLKRMFNRANELKRTLRIYRVNHPLLNSKVTELMELMDSLLSSHPLFTQLANQGQSIPSSSTPWPPPGTPSGGSHVVRQVGPESYEGHQPTPRTGPLVRNAEKYLPPDRAHNGTRARSSASCQGSRDNTEMLVQAQVHHGADRPTPPGLGLSGEAQSLYYTPALNGNGAPGDTNTITQKNGTQDSLHQHREPNLTYSAGPQNNEEERYARSRIVSRGQLRPPVIHTAQRSQEWQEPNQYLARDMQSQSQGSNWQPPSTGAIGEPIYTSVGQPRPPYMPCPPTYLTRTYDAPATMLQEVQPKSVTMRQHESMPTTRFDTSRPQSVCTSVSSVPTTPADGNAMKKMPRIVNKIDKCINDIRQITKEPTAGSTRKKVIEFSTYEVPKLRNYLKVLSDLEEKADANSTIDDAVYDNIDRTYEEAERWEQDIEALRRSFHLHLDSDKSLLKKVTLQTFSGSHSEDTVYQFLETFTRLTESTCAPDDQATLLFTSYLSASIQRECEHLKSNIDKLKEFLIMRYGDLREVCEAKTLVLSQLKHPSNNPTSKVEYYKSVSQLLSQLESLVGNPFLAANEIENVIYTSTYVRSITSHMPNPVITQFAKRVERDRSGKPVTGQEQWNILKDLIDSTWRQEKTVISIKQQNYSEQSKKDQPPQRAKSNNVGSKSARTKTTFPCPFHAEAHEVHELGNCSLFFKESNEHRNKLAKANFVCYSCLKKECTKMSRHACITTNLPAGLSCPECGSKNPQRPRNVLLCTNSSHTAPKLKELEGYLKEYLKVFDKGLLSQLQPHFNLLGMQSSEQVSAYDRPRSKSSKVNPKVEVPKYDTETGDNLNANTPITRENGQDAVYIFQIVRIKDRNILIFYDSGATSHVVRGRLAEESKFKVVSQRVEMIGTVSNRSLWTEYGKYSAVLGSETQNQSFEMIFQGMEQITGKFPRYYWNEVNEEVMKSGKLEDVPLPKYVGGQSVDILIGIKSVDLAPKFLFKLNSGLGVYSCPLMDIFGSSIAYGGSHQCISEVHKSFGNVTFNTASVMFSRSNMLNFETEVLPRYEPLVLPLSSKQSLLYATTPVTQELLSVPSKFNLPEFEIQNKCPCLVPDDYAMRAKIPLEKYRRAMEFDEAPLDQYRCEVCENCEKCQSSDTLQSTSLRERAEQVLIENSITINYQEKKAIVKLPFTQNPVTFFNKVFNGESNNLQQALQTYGQMARKPKDITEGIQKAMNEYIDLGFISKLADAPLEIQNRIQSAPINHFYMWRYVLKLSPTTPVRIIVDPSSTMMNMIMAKGNSGLQDMMSILLRARTSPKLWMSDIRKLYNNLVMHEDCLEYSLLVYHPSMDPNTQPDWYLFNRAWFGNAAVGPQASATLKRVASDHKKTHDQGAQVLMNDTYVDDTCAGSKTHSDREAQITQVTDLLSKVSMKLKYVIRSGEPVPEECLSENDSVPMLGYKYFPERDTLSINLQEMNFQAKKRGMKPPNEQPASDMESLEKLIDEQTLTRRKVLSKTMELYDPMGLIEPMKSMLKRSLASISHLDFSDKIPPEEIAVWKAHLMNWPALAELEFPRSVMPIDSREVRLIVVGDASSDAGGAAAYIGYRKSDNTWTNNLLFSKSRMLHASVPRNELQMLLLACEMMYAIIVSLNINFRDILIVTDSRVALCWASNPRAKNTPYVFNRMLTIQRYISWSRKRMSDTTNIEIVHVAGNINSADLLTKGVITIADLKQHSTWIKGYPWMMSELAEMPLTRFHEISLSGDEAKDYSQECKPFEISSFLKDHGNYHIYQSDGDFGSMAGCMILPDADMSQENLSLVLSQRGEGAQQLQNTNSPYLADPVYYGWRKASSLVRIAATFCLNTIHRIHNKSVESNMAMKMYGRCAPCQIIHENKISAPTIGYRFFSMDGTTNVINETKVNRLIENGKSNPILEEDIFKDSDVVGSSTTNSNKRNTLSEDKAVGIKGIIPIFDPTSEIFQQAKEGSRDMIRDYHWDLQATKESYQVIPKAEKERYTENSAGILFYKGRLSNDQKWSVVDLDLLDLNFLDEIKFNSPCLPSRSPIFHAFATYIHTTVVPHAGFESTLREISKRFHVIHPRKTLAQIIGECKKCIIIKKETLKLEMSRHSSLRFTAAPPFSMVMIDLAQHFNCKARINSRQTVKCPALVCVCIVTGATAIYMLEDWQAQSVIQGLERCASRHGMPSVIFIDAGSQLRTLVKADTDVRDFNGRLRCKIGASLVQAAPKSHSSQGKVERKIRSIRELLDRFSESGFLMSFLSWETLFCKISNYLNDLPISRPSSTALDRPEFNIITPNRLLVGRSNTRSLAGPIYLDSTPSNILARINKAQTTFYQLLHKQIHLFIPKSKWFKTSDIHVDDIVLFFLEESQLKQRLVTWHYARVTTIVGARLTLEYTIYPSSVKKYIERGPRQVVRIASEEELSKPPLGRVSRS